MGSFGSVLGKVFVVERAGGDGVEGKIEGVFPTEFEAGLAKGVVAVLGAGVAFGEVAGKRGGWNEADHRLLRSFSGIGWGGNVEVGGIGRIGLIGPIFLNYSFCFLRCSSLARVMFSRRLPLLRKSFSRRRICWSRR